jgi:hypothetical protein
MPRLAIDPQKRAQAEQKFKLKLNQIYRHKLLLEMLSSENALQLLGLHPEDADLRFPFGGLAEINQRIDEYHDSRQAASDGGGDGEL